MPIKRMNTEMIERQPCQSSESEPSTRQTQRNYRRKPMRALWQRIRSGRPLTMAEYAQVEEFLKDRKPLWTISAIEQGILPLGVQFLPPATSFLRRMEL